MNPKAVDDHQPNLSHYDLFRGKFIFVDEPYWLRLVLAILVLLAVPAVIFSLRHYAWPVLCMRWLSRLPGIKNLFDWMNRSP